MLTLLATSVVGTTIQADGCERGVQLERPLARQAIAKVLRGGVRAAARLPPRQGGHQARRLLRRVHRAQVPSPSTDRRAVVGTTRATNYDPGRRRFAGQRTADQGAIGCATAQTTSRLGNGDRRVGGAKSYRDVARADGQEVVYESIGYRSKFYGGSDFSIGWRAAWDEAWLYLALNVTDDEHFLGWGEKVNESDPTSAGKCMAWDAVRWASRSAGRRRASGRGTCRPSGAPTSKRAGCTTSRSASARGSRRARPTPSSRPSDAASSSAATSAAARSARTRRAPRAARPVALEALVASLHAQVRRAAQRSKRTFVEAARRALYANATEMTADDIKWKWNEGLRIGVLVPAL